MQNNKFVVLDIGSGKLRLAELEFDEGNLELEGYSEVEYAGFTDGAFIEDDLLDACKKLFNEVESEEISCVYVGVPSEFCGQVVEEKTCTFDSPVDVNGSTRLEFLRYAESDEQTSKITDGIVIDVNVLSLTPHEVNGEDNGAINVTGRVSYIYADRQFLDKVSKTLESLGYTNLEFSSSINAQSQQMTTPEMREIGTILIDVGYLSTSVAVIKGDGIESLRSFSLGGAHISAELSENLKLPFKVADKLKRKVLLTVDPSEVDYYVVAVDGQEYEIEASKVNKVVKAKIEHIAVMVSKCISEEEYAYQFIVTGGALNDIKGALDVLSSKLGVVVKDEKLEYFDLDKPGQSAIISLIKQASQRIRSSQSELSLWKKIWEKIKSWFDF